MSLVCIQIVSEVQDYENKKSEFIRLATFVSNLYFTALPKVDIQFLRKIVIEVTSDNGNHEHIVPYSKDLPICTIQCAFDFSTFFSGHTFSKIKGLVKFLHQQILKLSIEFGWDSSPFVLAYEKVKESDYKNQAIIGKIKSSRDKKHKAGIGVEQDIESASIFILFFDTNNKVLEKLKVFETLPQPYLYTQLIGKSKWLNNSEFVLHNKSEEVRIVASITDKNLSVMYIPKRREVDGIKEELKFIAKGNILPNWFG